MRSNSSVEFQRDEAVWRATPVSGVELLRARYVQQRFPRHTHECFVFCVNEAGAHASWYAGSTLIIPHGAVTVVPPGEVHTGHPVPGYPWHYRAMYVADDVVRALAEESGFSGRTPPSFRSLFTHDALLADAFARTHARCERADDDLESEGLIANTLIAVLQRHAVGAQRAAARRTPKVAVERARDFIRDSYRDRITLDAVAGAAMISRYALLRAFGREVGITPYAYVTQVRVEEAKSLLRRGVGIATAAARAGFADQSHLTRHFKRLTGVTPGVYVGRASFSHQSNSH